MNDIYIYIYIYIYVCVCVCVCVCVYACVCVCVFASLCSNVLGKIRNPFIGGASGVMGIVTGYGHGDTSSIPGQDWLHFTYPWERYESNYSPSSYG